MMMKMNMKMMMRRRKTIGVGGGGGVDEGGEGVVVVTFKITGTLKIDILAQTCTLFAVVFVLDWICHVLLALGTSTFLLLGTSLLRLKHLSLGQRVLLAL